MIKIYIENKTNSGNVGGGWTFMRNFKKSLQDKVEFVDNWQDSDIVFVFGITAMDKGKIHEAVKAGKKLVLRVDNIPRMSRNKRQTPYERLTEFGGLASLVVYQSKWCKEYAGYFIKNQNEVIINNGVDTTVFNSDGRQSDGKTYLYINYNDNPNKRFDEAIYWFDMEWRNDKDSKMLVAGNIPRIYLEHPEYNFDSVSGSEIIYAGIMNTPEDVAKLMKTCDILLYPAAMEAYPNTLLEAMSCGLRPAHINSEGGSLELVNNTINQATFDPRLLRSDVQFPLELVKVKTIQEMGEEYLEQFSRLV